MDQVTVVIIDDHPSMRSGVAVDLGEAFLIVATAGDVASGSTAVEVHRPDVVVSDVQLPDGSGADVMRAVHEITPVLVLSVTTDTHAVIDYISAGAKGYLSKAADVAELRAAVLEGCVRCSV